MADELTERRTILVVEDEPAVRRWVAYCLSQAGYRILEAADGREALEVLARCTPPVDLVLTDIRMPGTDGAALGRLVGERWPGMRVLYMSGYAGEALAEFNLVPTSVPSLQKPFTPDELLDRVAAGLMWPTGEISPASMTSHPARPPA